MTTETWRDLGIILLVIMVVSVTLGTIILAVGWRQLKRMNIPQGIGFAETLHYTPFLIVLAIDLLDLGLDFLAAPVSWVILDRLGLKALRGVSAVEAFIPGTQFIPTLTACWIGVRLFGIRGDKRLEIRD
jgi:hypothetical protein